MENLRNASLVEGLLTDDYELRVYSGTVLAKRFGNEVLEMIAAAWKGEGDFPHAFYNDKGCREALGRADHEFLSVSAIMDFYRNGPDKLHACVKRQMVLSHRDYIFYLMNHYYPSFVRSYADDLYDCGVIGLLAAMEGYNGQNAFTTYSKFYIIHEMASFTYYLQGNPSCYYAKIQKQIRDVIGNDIDTDISIKEISRKTGIREDIVVRELRMMHTTEFVRIDEFPALVEGIVDERVNIEKTVEDRLLYGMLKQAVTKLEREDKELLMLYFWRNYSFGRIAREKGVCYSRVKKRYMQILDALRKEII